MDLEATEKATVTTEDHQGVSSVEREGDFLRFLLTGAQGQVLLLLKNLTIPQTNAISEIFQNILYSPELDEVLIKSLSKQKNILRKIGEKKSGIGKRKAEIKLHSLAVLRILKRVEDILPV